MNTFVAHPSIRIKGTENNYEPIQCIDPSCQNKNPHMHCPFCVKSDYYHDPVILKAHYRVKHVDKGIEFGGLKVLRCCDHCYIVGSIKGTKEFKGAHWHCYRCRNGFNRRDEAFKHYRTHFRNPQTTFQIQVATEVNQMFSLSEEAENATQVLNATEHSTLSTTDGATFVNAGSSLVTVTSDLTHGALAGAVNGKVTADGSAGELQVSVAANETVGTSEPTTIIIHVEDEDASDAIAINDATIEPVGQFDEERETSAEDWQAIREELEQRLSDLARQNTELAQMNNRLITEKADLVKELKLQTNNYKAQLEVHSEELTQSRQREQELVEQLSVPLDGTVTQLLTSLKAQHEELLHHQLARLRQAYLHPLSPQPQTGSILTLALPPAAHINTQHIVNNSEPQSEGMMETIELKVSEEDLMPQSRTDGNGVYVYADATGEGEDTVMVVKAEITEEENSDAAAFLAPVEVTIGQKRPLEVVDEEDNSSDKAYDATTKRHKDS